VKKRYIMKNQVLSKVEDQIKQYKAEHHGEKPLYIVLADEEADSLMAEVKEKHGYDPKMVVTEFSGVKIVKYLSLKPGEIRLTNDLPDTGS
jgi:hypothetical protein